MHHVDDKLWLEARNALLIIDGVDDDSVWGELDVELHEQATTTR